MKAAEIEAWLDQVAGAYNLLPMDATAFRLWAQLIHRKSNTLMEDAMIAATAQTHGLTVVSRNVADFQALVVNVKVRGAERAAAPLAERPSRPPC